MNFFDSGRSQPFAKLLLVRRDSLFSPENNPRPTQVVRGQLNSDFVARENANIVHPHFPGNKPVNNVPIFQLNLESCIGEVLDDLSLHLNQIFLRHPISPRAPTP